MHWLDNISYSQLGLAKKYTEKKLEILTATLAQPAVIFSELHWMCRQLRVVLFFCLKLVQ